MQIRRPFLRFLPLGSLCGALLCASGCASGQIGGDVELGEGNPAAAVCETDQTTPIEPDEPTTLGVQARDLFALVSGTHTSSMLWAPASSSGATVHPSSSTTNVELRITPIATSARLVSWKPRTHSGGMELAAPLDPTGDPCAPELAFDADVQIVSDNGALDEKVVATFWARNGTLVRSWINRTRADADFTVSLDTTPRPELSQWSIQLTFSSVGFAGSVQGTLETINDEVASAGAVELARFPEEACPSTFGGTAVPVNSDAKLFKGTQDVLHHLDSLTMHWESEPATQVNFDPTIETLCLIETNEGLSLVGNLSSRVVSQDGKVDGTWALEVHLPLTKELELESLSILRQAYLADTFALENFERATGIQGVEAAPGSRLSFSFQLNQELHPQATSPHGALTILEIVSSSCLEASTDVDLTPPCPGPDVRELDEAQFSAPPPS